MHIKARVMVGTIELYTFSISHNQVRDRRNILYLFVSKSELIIYYCF